MAVEHAIRHNIRGTFVVVMECGVVVVVIRLRHHFDCFLVDEGLPRY